MDLKEGKMLLQLYTSIKKKCHNICFMTLPACQLSEYCLNREPELFSDTKFWHDLFHSITHVCRNNFKSVRIEGLEGINTEICEQSNEFLQCVKYTGSHLSQEHFMFFVQFFLYIFNKQKTEKFRKMAIMALACQQ